MKNNLAIIESDSVIVSMTRASMALAEAVTVGQTKTLIDVAYAAEIYSKRHHLSDEAIGRALSVKVDATRKLGEILKATPKAKGEIYRGSKMTPRENSAPTLEELGLSKKESSVAQKLADLPEEQFEQVRLGNVTIAKAIAAVDVKPKAAPAPVVAPEEVPEEINEDKEAIAILSEENDRLNDRLAVAAMDATEEERAAAAATMHELRMENKLLRSMNKQLTISRDTFQNQVAEMQKQINRQRREIDKALGTKTA
jgi:hypothetical protein